MTTPEDRASPPPDGAGAVTAKTPATQPIDYQPAEATWNEFFVAEHGPARAIIDAILALPEDEAPTVREETLPLIRLTRVGAYHGRRYRVIGYGYRKIFVEIRALHAL